MDFTIECTCKQCDSKFMNAKAVLDNEESTIFTCQNGHQTESFIAVPRFSLYFDKSIQALVDEFYYEAYSWAYTALEVFRKDFAKAYLSIYNKLDIQSIDDTFEKRFRYSENIYGAYAFAYLSYFGFGPDAKDSPFPILQNKEVQRRNDMFHQGKLPTTSNVENDIYQIYLHMLFGYHNFIDGDKDSGKLAIMFYYLNRFHKWIGEKNVPEDKITNGETTIFGADLGAFGYNTVHIINANGEGNYPTLDELKARARNTRKIIERNRNV